jgi:hypothetical protein
LNRDPLGESAGINLYNYCANNPISGIDPLGTDFYQLYSTTGFAGQGHSASIVGNPEAGYTYYSTAPEGKSQRVHVDNLADLYDPKYVDTLRGGQLMGRYDKGTQLYTTPEQDADMMSYGDQNYDKGFSGLTHNCSNGSRDIANSTTLPHFPTLSIRPVGLHKQMQRYVGRDASRGQSITPSNPFGLQYHGAP